MFIEPIMKNVFVHTIVARLAALQIVSILVSFLMQEMV